MATDTKTRSAAKPAPAQKKAHDDGPIEGLTREILSSLGRKITPEGLDLVLHVQNWVRDKADLYRSEADTHYEDGRLAEAYSQYKKALEYAYLGQITGEINVIEVSLLLLFEHIFDKVIEAHDDIDYKFIMPNVLEESSVERLKYIKESGLSLAELREAIELWRASESATNEEASKWPSAKWKDASEKLLGKKHGIIIFLKREWEPFIKASRQIVSRDILALHDEDAEKAFTRYLETHDFPKDISIVYPKRLKRIVSQDP